MSTSEQIKKNNKNQSKKKNYNAIISYIDSIFFNEISFNKTVKFNCLPMIFNAITDYIEEINTKKK